MRNLTRTLDDLAKRTFDATTSLFALTALAFPLAAIGGAIKLDSPGPIFYLGDRVGRGGKPFKLIKFRSMRVGADRGASTTSESDDRVTALGKILRRYKLDELPQLLNVLKGDMSLVGPRPQVPWCVATFSEEERAVLTVRPGITDWASIQFHDEGAIIAESGIDDPDEAYLKLIHPAKTRLQLRYVRERSFLVDLKILAKTATTLVHTRATRKPSEPAEAEA